MEKKQICQLKRVRGGLRTKSGVKAGRKRPGRSSYGNITLK